MRALFLAAPGIGHAFPMVPLAWALRSAGHEVAVATAEFVRATGHGADPGEVAVGLPVEVAFQPASEEITMPYWRPRRGGAA